MASVKGITIEIGGNTTKLTESLKVVNKEIQGTQKDLKELNKLLKVDPGNTDLLAQKQKALKDAIGATSEKLKQQKTALEQLKNTPQTEETIRKQEALTREIEKTEQGLKALKNEYNSFGSVAGAKLQSIGQSMQDFGGKVSSAGRSLAPLSAAVAGIGTVATMKFAEVDKTMSLTNATMKNTAEEAAFLDKAMQEAAKNSTFGMADAANATLNFARAGLDAREAAAALAPAMNLAAGEGGNLDTVSAGLVATINSFHDSFENTSYYADIFAAACNNSALDVNTLSQSMSIAAPTFHAAGMNIQDTALYLGILANNGIEANVGATGLKTGLARLAKPAKAGATAIERLGIEVFNADGSMKDSVEIQKILHDSFATLSEKEQLAAASAIFGKNQMATWLALINTAPEDVRKLDKSLSDCTGTTDKMAEAMMSGFGGSIERLKSGIDVLMTTLGRAVADAITPMIAKCQELVDWFSKLDDNSRSNIVTLGLFVAAVSPFLIITGQLITAIGTITTALGTLYTFLTLKLIPAIGTVASVIGWPIAIIGSIIVIVYELIDAIFGAGTAAKLISGIWQGACEFMKFCIQGVVDFVKGCIDIIVGAWNWLKHLIFGGTEEIAQNTDKQLQEIKKDVKQVTTDTATETTNTQSKLRQDLADINTGIKTDTAAQWSEINHTVTSENTSLSENTKNAWQNNKTVVKTATNEMTQAVTTLTSNWRNVANSLNGLGFDWIQAFPRLAMDGLNKVNISAVETQISIEELAFSFQRFGGDVSLLSQHLVEECGLLPQHAKSIAETIKKEFNKFADSSKSMAKSVVNDVKEIQTKTQLEWGKTKNETSGALNNISSNVKDTFKQTRDTAINTTAEIRNSQAQQWGAIQTQTNSALKGISGGASNNFDSIKRQNLEMANYINAAWRNIQKNINESLHAIYSNVNTTFTNIKSSLQRAIIELKGLFNFEWSLPRIKVPHFKLEGKFDVEAGTVPRISVEWYKKAMNDAYILQSPTIFGMAGGKLLGGGEAGSEAVVGTDKLADLIKTAVASVSGGSTVIPVYIGQERIEEIVVRANQNVNYRSGGR